MQHTSQQLFKFAAPAFDPSIILDHFAKKFAQIPAEKFEIMLQEFLKFMFLQSKYDKGFIPLIGEVDDIWHAFILRTREYEKFCFALPGACFLHHGSSTLDEFLQTQDQNKKAVTQQLLSWLPNYVQHFGKFTPAAAEYWFMIGFLQQEFGFSLGDINQMANQVLKTQPAIS